jgi:hypothetical protein
LHQLLGRTCEADNVQWVDQDEQNEAPDDDYMNSFGGGMGDDGGFGGIDFSKLGAGAGAGDEGAEMEGTEEGEEDEDEDMPELEDEEGDGEKAEAGESSKAAPKAQEEK